MTRYQSALEGPVQKTLSELKPQIGERVRLESRSPRGRFTVQLLGLREGGSVIVSAPRVGQGAPMLHEGTALTVRMMVGNWICAFESRLLKIQHNPYGFWHLDYPQRLDLQRVRRHTRVPVNMRVSIDVDEQDNASGLFPLSASCSDIHLEGACLEASRLLGQIEDKLYITARVSVSGIDHVILVPALIRNVYESETGAFPLISHGVEFIDLEEDTRLILAGFVYQQYLIETGFLEGSAG